MENVARTLVGWFDILMEGGWVVMRGFLGGRTRVASASASALVTDVTDYGRSLLRLPLFPPSPIAIAADRDENGGEDTVYN